VYYFSDSFKRYRLSSSYEELKKMIREATSSLHKVKTTTGPLSQKGDGQSLLAQGGGGSSGGRAGMGGGVGSPLPGETDGGTDIRSILESRRYDNPGSPSGIEASGTDPIVSMPAKLNLYNIKSSDPIGGSGIAPGSIGSGGGP